VFGKHIKSYVSAMNQEAALLKPGYLMMLSQIKFIKDRLLNTHMCVCACVCACACVHVCVCVHP